MTPIINPWWFYLFNLINNLRDFSFMYIGVGGMIIGAACLTCWICEQKIPPFIKNKWIKILFGFYLICTIILPSEETMYQMAAASLITPDNITTSVDFVTDIVTDIVNAVDEALED